jgi:hypothetical protein
MGKRSDSATRPRFVSGPVSVHEFVLTEGGHRLIIFGDEHFSYESLCQPCDMGTCQSVTRFIRAHVERAREAATSLDVFMEMPYVVPRGPQRDAMLRHLNAFMKRNAGPEAEQGLLNKVVHRIVGSTPFYVGVFSQLYKEFARDIYDDAHKSAAGRQGPGSVRFHYADARTEPNVRALLPGEADLFHKHVRTADALSYLLHAFLFGRDFESDVRQVSSSLASQLVSSALSGLPGSSGRRKLHKVAKQYHRLRDGPVKAAARAYLEERIEEAVSVMREDVHVDSGAHTLATADERATPSHNRPWLSNLRKFNHDLYRTAFQLGMRLSVHVVLMDAYLLCRLLRFAMQTPETSNGTSIVYVGDAHAEYYVRFFKDHLGLTPLACQTRHITSPDKKRCVDLAAAAKRRGSCRSA